jgi:DNA-binding response OmpR family regulator
MRALLVEDDVEIAKQIASVLEKERLTVHIAKDGDSGLVEALSRSYSIAILDVMLPKRDGWSLCDEIRRCGINMPVLMLTARDSVEDRVRGLEGGADDYLPKPFDARELVARVRALLRRDAVHRTGQIQIDDLQIDTHARTVRRGDNPLKLTPREYSLLVSLARNEGRILTREVILEDVWNNEESLENTVNFHITSLRKKVDYPGAKKLIHTVHGFGYSMRRPGDET